MLLATVIVGEPVFVETVIEGEYVVVVELPKVIADVVICTFAPTLADVVA